MADFEGEGGLVVKGCAGISRSVFLYFKYGPGDAVYICKQADRGRLEKVVVKKIVMVQNRRTYGRIVPMYVDTLNAQFEEVQLCTEAEAVGLATDYYNKLLVDVTDLLVSC